MQNQKLKAPTPDTVIIPVKVGLWNEQKAAKECDRSVSSLQKDRHYNRGIPYIKIGRSVRYRPEDVIDYCLRHRIDPNISATCGNELTNKNSSIYAAIEARKDF